MTEALVRLQLNDATPVVAGVVNHHPDLRGLDAWKRKLSPRLVVTRDVASGYGCPRGRGTTVSAAVLHDEVNYPFTRGRRRQRGLSRCRPVVLQGEDIDLINRLNAAESHLQRVRVGIAGVVVPTTGAASPAGAGAVAIDCRGSRKLNSMLGLDRSPHIRGPYPRRCQLKIKKRCFKVMSWDKGIALTQSVMEQPDIGFSIHVIKQVVYSSSHGLREFGFRRQGGRAKLKPARSHR